MIMIRKLKPCFVITIVISTCYLACQFWLAHVKDEDGWLIKDIPIILWWTPFVGDQNRLETCGKYECYITENREVSSHSNLGGILFYGTSFDINDLPLPRRKNIHWGLMHEESPRNNPMLTSPDALALFNHSATFSRHSDVPLMLADVNSKEDLLGAKYFVPTTEKSRLIKEEGLAPVLYIQSDCSTASDRDLYVTELMKYIPVDSYGACLNNKQLPERLKLDHVSSLSDEEFLSFTARYKFALAIENAICEDYITEKLWRPLIVGSVPVYYGSPSFKDWLPNDYSAIVITDFQEPKMLADFLLTISNNDSLYNQYLVHKTSNDRQKQITNSRLLNALEKRHDKSSYDFGNYVRALECIVCERLHENRMNKKSYIVTKDHYNCPMPVNPLTHKVDNRNWWVDQWVQGKCKAKLLVRHLATSLDTKLFYKQFWDAMRKGDC